MWYFAFSLAGIPFAWLQPREMLRANSRGVTAIENILTTFASCSFWVIYGAIVGDSAVFMVSVGYATTYGAIVLLWLWYYALDIVTAEVENRI